VFGVWCLVFGGANGTPLPVSFGQYWFRRQTTHPRTGTIPKVRNQSFSSGINPVLTGTIPFSSGINPVLTGINPFRPESIPF